MKLLLQLIFAVTKYLRYVFAIYLSLMCLLWKEEEGVISICGFEGFEFYMCFIVIKNIVFSFFQPGTMIEWGNYW